MRERSGPGMSRGRQRVGASLSTLRTPDGTVRGMESIDLSDDVARLERRIEDLASAADRSRRLALIARVSAAAAGLWLVAGTFRLVPLEATGLVLAIGVVLGGIVLAGSSRSTAEELDAAIRKAESERARLIDSIDPEPIDPRFRTIEPLTRTLH
jgi:hypothetical protein